LNMTAREKVKSSQEVQEICMSARRHASRIVFTNGCFDILHVGHVRYLEAARALGDMLVVGINSDDSVRQLKGPSRPVLGEGQRSELVAALHCVDYVTIFQEPDPLRLIEMIRPDVLVKGADWPEDQIIGADVVRKSGGSVARIPFVPGASTSAIIDSILTHFS
jgi:D-glycero-beta-D-manno-heptose 1-phosphate adenylyltransferase